MKEVESLLETTWIGVSFWSWWIMKSWRIIDCANKGELSLPQDAMLLEEGMGKHTEPGELIVVGTSGDFVVESGGCNLRRL